MKNSADEGAVLEAIEKIKALIRAAQQGETRAVRERLAKEAAEAHVLAMSAGTQLNGIQGQSATHVACMQLAAKGAFEVVATLLCEFSEDL